MALKPGQEKCIRTLDKPIVVAAGAGSGKTFTLTRRIVGALESGYVDDIGQVCAITFTNKAAAELKSRVKSALRASGMAEQALKADDAWISTIHGMCARILRAHAVELDLDPSFAMADEAQVRQFLDEAVDQVLADAESGVASGTRGDAHAEGQAGPDAAAIAALFAEYDARTRGMGGASVESMLRRIVGLACASPGGAAAFQLPQNPVRPAALVDAALDAFEQVVEAASQEKPSKSRDAWLADAQEKLDAVRSELATGGICDAVQGYALVGGLKISRNFGSKAYKERAAECASMLGTCVAELRLAGAEPHLRTLVALAARVAALFAARKRMEGVLDNNDLLVLAADALEGHPDIAAAYADKFRLVMVDEFQDTDQMQVDMIKRIAGPGACRLCTVGDAQQSIYRFRGADVSVYRRHLHAVRAADVDGVIVLPDNFRSHADVLSFVDRVFERPDMFGGEFMSLAPGRDESQVSRPFAPGEPRVLVQQVTQPFRGVSSDEVVAEQARRVAAAFAHLKEAGHPAGDMAVLLGRMKNAGVFARELRAQGLACVVAGGSVFAGTPEATAVLELARIAVNPADTQALYNVLAGPMFGVSDDDLLALATRADKATGEPRRQGIDAGLRTLMRTLADADAQAASDPAPIAGYSPQMRHAAQVVGSLVRSTGRGLLSRALMHAVVDAGWVSRLQAQGAEGLAAAGNVYKAIRMVEDVEARNTAGPVGVLRAFESALEMSKEAPGALSVAGGDFVRIMTVHASKGLEFPIVAVAEFKDVSGDASRLLALPDGTGKVLLSLDLGKTRDNVGTGSDRDLYPQLLEGCDDEDSLIARARDASGALEQRAAMYEHGRLGDEEEAKRLLYVALTRAKEALVVCLGGTRTKDNPNGVPKNCLSAVLAALSGSDAGFEPGTTMCSFGGSAPAVVEHVALEAGGREDPAPDACEGVAAPAPFGIPAIEEDASALHVPYADAHAGIFSYSSVAGGSHEGDLLDALAARYALGSDAAAPDTPGLAPDRPDEEGFLLQRDWENALAAMGDEDDGSWAYLGSEAADADKATDFGTAFHRLAQLAVLARKPGAALAMPPASRVRAMLATCGLDGRQWSRLDDALARWFGSDEAARMAAFADLRAEVPFLVPLALPDGANVFLEGEIDLLAFDETGTKAQVVDYKTGGHADEDAPALARKHVLQASCYAFALLLQGVHEVEASFVRVERPRADDSAQPQCVRYRFTAADVPVLAEAIARAYMQA